MMMKSIRIGIFGLSRGYDNVDSILLNNAEIVAGCDQSEVLRERMKQKLPNIALYDSFDEFLNHDMDAVYLANNFAEHTKFAVRALEKNIHVISECTASGTLAECVELTRAAEKSRAIYMLAENYPYMLFNLEMQKVYKSGKLGKVLFAEGEYNHPVGPDDTYFIRRYEGHEKHWRFYVPATYYITHSLGPLMCATHSNPIRVTAMPIYFPRDDRYATASYVGDNSAIITCLNDDNSVFRVTGCAHFGGHENSYRLACENGQIENVRGDDKVMLRYDPWTTPIGEEQRQFYHPAEDVDDAVRAKKTGHAGGDYYMFKDFFQSIREGTQPCLDAYVATRMSAVAILAHRSLMQYGVPYDVPDFRKEEDRVKYENDRETPFWGNDGSAPTIPCCSHPEFRPSEENLRKYREVFAPEAK
ncbi:MAG: Gfo/Idh/MocA family oxidoreductase [Firmicutes bacterium]|nr:Gfo/Idh/MocA family oxidoreductase [Candidatus Colimorpha enterica]